MQISETELHMPTLLSVGIDLFYTAQVIKYITIFGMMQLSRENDHQQAIIIQLSTKV